MAHDDLETLRISFKSPYHLAKKKRPFSDYTDIITPTIKCSI